jgi:hypothetical protein
MNRVVKVLIGIVVAVAVVFVLFTTVFPWVDRTLNNPTMGSAPAPAQVTVGQV